MKINSKKQSAFVQVKRYHDDTDVFVKVSSIVSIERYYDVWFDVRDILMSTYNFDSSTTEYNSFRIERSEYDNMMQKIGSTGLFMHISDDVDVNVSEIISIYNINKYGAKIGMSNGRHYDISTKTLNELKDKLDLI